MPHSSQVRTTAARRGRAAALALLAVAVAVVIGAAVGVPAGSLSPSTATRLVTEHGGPVPDGATVDDGLVPGGGTSLDGSLPGVAELDPELLAALHRAAGDAAEDGVAVTVSSGWRSSEYQEQLLREAVSQYGSADEAARWVATPDTSAHVSGDAVDLGPARARAWLAEHGARYGLCQTYRNEPWHFELRPGAVDRGCPAMYADPTHDPRMHG